MGLCSSSQKQLAVSPAQHKFRELEKFSDTQASELRKKNAQIAEQRVEIHEKNEELIQARETLESTAERLKIQEELYAASEECHLNDFQEIVRIASVAAKNFTLESKLP